MPLSLQPLSQRRAQGLGINGVTAQLFEGQRVLGETGPKGSVGTEGWVSKNAEGVHHFWAAARCPRGPQRRNPGPPPHPAAPQHPGLEEARFLLQSLRLHGSLCTQPRAWTRLAGGMGTWRLGLSAAPLSAEGSPAAGFWVEIKQPARFPPQGPARGWGGAPALTRGPFFLWRRKALRDVGGVPPRQGAST